MSELSYLEKLLDGAEVEWLPLGVLGRVRISTLRNENETFSQLNSITYIGVFCVW